MRMNVRGILGTGAVLSDLAVPIYRSMRPPRLGMDTLMHCRSKTHYLRWRDAITYEFNSRGFRDREWPWDLTGVTWCVGDSETMGLGLPIEQTWPRQLEQITGRPSIMISLLGAGNEWIRDAGQAILHSDPRAKIILHWSFLWRRMLSMDDPAVVTAINREWQQTWHIISDPSWPACDHYQDFDYLPLELRQRCAREFPTTGEIFRFDGENYTLRLVPHSADHFRVWRRTTWQPGDDQDDVKLMLDCINALPATDNILHSWIPESMTPDQQQQVLDHCARTQRRAVPPIQPRDWARDGFHYGPQSARSLAEILHHCP